MKYISENRLPKGIITAIVTPFRYGQVDLKAFEKLIHKQITDGATALVVLGTTGEASSLTEKERCKVIEKAVDYSKGKLFMIVGTGSYNTEKSVSWGKKAADLGADAILSVTPYYVKPNQQGLIRHYSVLADSVPCPVILYNVPSRTGTNISLDTVRLLLEHENILGLKEAGTDLDDILSKIFYTDPGKIYCGNDLFLPLFAHLGCAGCISVASNACYSRLNSLFQSYSERKYTEADEQFLKLRPFLKALCCDTNPIPIKSIMSDMGLITEEIRLPLTKLDENKRKDLLLSAVLSEII